MIALSILLSVCLLLLTILSFPVRVRFESNPVCTVNWLFVKIRIRSVQGNYQSELKLFNRKTRWLKKKKRSEKKGTSPSPKKKKKSKPNITKELILESLTDIAVKKILRVGYRFCLRCIRSMRVRMLHWEIGLKDCYWQGILTGLLHSIPRSDHVRLSGNFQEQNRFVLVINISILRILMALLLFLFRFPYLKAYLLYRRVYLQKT